MDDKVKGGKNRLYIPTPNGDAELLYELGGGVMRIYHTFVPELERGKGLAERLALAGFELAEEKGMKVKPDCDYLKRFVEKHSELSGACV